MTPEPERDWPVVAAEVRQRMTHLRASRVICAWTKPGSAKTNDALQKAVGSRIIARSIARLAVNRICPVYGAGKCISKVSVHRGG
jgi:hypothetical protein